MLARKAALDLKSHLPKQRSSLLTQLFFARDLVCQKVSNPMEAASGSINNLVQAKAG